MQPAAIPSSPNIAGMGEFVLIALVGKLPFVEAGDALRICFDLKQKVAIVALGEGASEEARTSLVLSTLKF